MRAMIVKTLIFISAILLPVKGYGNELSVTVFEDSFETHGCNAEIDFLTPEAGSHWFDSGDYSTHTIDCVLPAADGNSSLRIERVNGGNVTGYTFPALYTSQGFTCVFEHDVYLPAGYNDAGFAADNGASYVPMRWYYNSIRGTWHYWTGSPAPSYVDTGIQAPLDEWVHVKVELYDDLTYSMWASSESAGTQVIADKVPWADLDDNYLGIVLRPQIGPGVNGSTTYWDNFNAYRIDHTSQGYPPIYESDSPIVIDGVVDTITEWDGAKKVASKPLNSKGNFNPWFAGAKTDGLSDDTTVDVYVAHDANFFYIGAVMNNIVTGAFTYTENGRFRSVFAFYPDNGMNPDGTGYASYTFTCYATGSDPNANPFFSGVEFEKIEGIPANPPQGVAIDPNDFYNSGGEIWYTHDSNTNVMNVEMKVPFVFLTEFGGISEGKKVDLQFNVAEEGATQGGRYGTTNQIGEIIPWFPSGLASSPRPSRPFPPGIGIAFPTCGDEDHPIPNGDINEDCRVDYKDLFEITSNWLISNEP